MIQFEWSPVNNDCKRPLTSALKEYSTSESNARRGSQPLPRQPSTWLRPLSAVRTTHVRSVRSGRAQHLISGRFLLQYGIIWAGADGLNNSFAAGPAEHWIQSLDVSIDLLLSACSACLPLAPRSPGNRVQRRTAPPGPFPESYHMSSVAAACSHAAPMTHEFHQSDRTASQRFSCCPESACLPADAVRLKAMNDC